MGKRHIPNSRDICAVIAISPVGLLQVFLVGDPIQLPATVISKRAVAYGYDVSLFKRLQTAGYPVHVLDTQYRMHPDICRFPSNQFYGGGVKTGEGVEEATRRPWHAKKVSPCMLLLMACIHPGCYGSMLSLGFQPVVWCGLSVILPCSLQLHTQADVARWMEGQLIERPSRHCPVCKCGIAGDRQDLLSSL